MSSDDCRLVLIIVDEGVELDVMEVLAEMGLEHFTRIGDVSGSGETGRREGNPIWPGLNSILYVFMPTAQVQPLVDRCHAVRDSFPITPGMKFIVLPAEML